MDIRFRRFKDAIKAQKNAGQTTIAPQIPPVPAPFDVEKDTREDEMNDIKYIVTTYEHWEAEEYLDIVEQQADLAKAHVQAMKEKAKKVEK